VRFSFSSASDELSSIFEPNVPPPSERLKTFARFKREGIPCGIFLLPVIPFITDTSEMIMEILKKVHDIGINFVIFGGMTLKDGKQRTYFYNVLKESLSRTCSKIYTHL